MIATIFALVITALSASAPVGAAKNPTSVLQAAPNPVRFGTRPVGSFTLKDAVIKNVGASTVNFLVTIDGMPDDFSFGQLPGSTCPPFEPAPLAPGKSCKAVVGFRPSAFFAGREQRARLRATATDPATGAVLDSVLIEYTGRGK